MTFILDTSVAILLRDANTGIAQRVAQLAGPVVISIMTRVELEGGSAGAEPVARARRSRLDAMLSTLPALEFDGEAADRYRSILEATGFSRRKIIDRMIAAQALVGDATLVTMNGDDFKDVPGLKLLAW